MLSWLETLGPPDVTASNANPRRTVTHFVPINDAAVIGAGWYTRRSASVATAIKDLTDRPDAGSKAVARVARLRAVDSQITEVGRTPPSAALELLPFGRPKQPRMYPSVTPTDPTVVFTWSEPIDDQQARLLDALLARVTRLGHSSSLVSCRLLDDPPAPTLTPGPGPDTLRWVAPGQLDALEELFERHQGSRPRSLPATEYRYRDASANDSTAPELSNLAGAVVLFELASQHRRMAPMSTTTLTRALREAVFSYADDPLPEGLTGHRASGEPSTSPHMAVLALPYVGSAYADGRIKGLAVVLPSAAGAEAAKAAYRGIGAWEAEGELVLTLGRHGRARLRRVLGRSELQTLAWTRWIGPARTWSSVTPIALPSYPGKLRGAGPTSTKRAWERAERAVADACVHLGLPAPTYVHVSYEPQIVGAVAAPRYPAFHQRSDGGKRAPRPLVHATVQFSVDVAGPVVLGSGRYFGLGLMAPVRGGDANA